MADIVALHRRIDRTPRSGGPPTGTPHPGTTGVSTPAGPSGRPGPELPGAELPGAEVPRVVGHPGGRLGLAGHRGHPGLAGLVRSAGVSAGVQADEAGPGGDRILPVLPELRYLLPAGGLRRGSTVAVVPGVTSVLFALLAGASAAGSWCAVAGLPTLGALAAADLGVALDRLALVPEPGPDWPDVVAALLDGMDLVVAAPPGPVAAAVAGRLAARARQRGSVLVPYARWPGADVVLESPGGGWQGLGQGRGRLRRRELVIRARGRGAAARPREVTVWLPEHTGALAAGPGRPAGRPGHPEAALPEAVLSGAAPSEAELPGAAIAGAMLGAAS